MLCSSNVVRGFRGLDSMHATGIDTSREVLRAAATRLTMSRSSRALGV